MIDNDHTAGMYGRCEGFAAQASTRRDRGSV